MLNGRDSRIGGSEPSLIGALRKRAPPPPRQPLPAYPSKAAGLKWCRQRQGPSGHLHRAHSRFRTRHPRGEGQVFPRDGGTKSGGFGDESDAKEAQERISKQPHHLWPRELDIDSHQGRKPNGRTYLLGRYARILHVGSNCRRLRESPLGMNRLKGDTALAAKEGDGPRHGWVAPSPRPMYYGIVTAVPKTKEGAITCKLGTTFPV